MAKLLFPSSTTSSLLKPTLAVSCQAVSKQFKRGGVVAVNNVSLAIPSGTLFGLIGADGAGKTTLIRILATLLSHPRAVHRFLAMTW